MQIGIVSLAHERYEGLMGSTSSQAAVLAADSCNAYTDFMSRAYCQYGMTSFLIVLGATVFGLVAGAILLAGMIKASRGSGKI